MDKDIRFVAHIDILGMSALVEKNSDEAWGMLSDLVAVKDKIASYELEFLDTNKKVLLSNAICSTTFSDTIIFFSTGASDVELRCIIILVTEIMHKAMCRCVPVRAGIAMGKFFFNFKRSMYAGPALIEAYRIGESTKWLGITLADSIEKRALALGMKSNSSDLIIEWQVPIRGGVANHLVVNWPAAFANDLNIKLPVSISEFYAGFENAFGPFENLGDDVKAKYIKTVEFLNKQLACRVS